MPAGLFVNIVNFFGTRMHIIWRMLGANGKNWRKLTSVYDILTGKRLLRAHRAEVDVEDPGRIIMESASTKESFFTKKVDLPIRT